jgi:alanine racemase
MLGITPSLYVDTIIAYNITPVICSLDVAETYAKAAAKRGALVSGLVAIDTGMGRIGYRPDEEHAIPEIKAMSQLEGFKIRGLITHFSDADAADKEYSRMQEKQYHDFCKALEAEGIKIPIKTLANSAAIMDLPETHCDAVRAGIIMYGLYPSDDVDHSQLDLTPVMSVKASIVHLKEVPPGTSISYGRKFTTDRVSKIATIALGYADGYPRPYSPVGKVIVNGCFAPIAGNICMDQCMIDVTDVPEVKVGDEVIIMGSDGTNTILADDIAAATGTINYEIICAFGQRLPKVYI